MTAASGSGLRRDLALKRPDDVYNAIVDAHRDLDDAACRAFDARLILLLANQVGDDAAVLAAIDAARETA
ncbi:MAG: DUF2783 domain-containing protein [Alphaproteobacteria bacterium]|nr:DUF2783 domain-containing protein [Alphaproteobacteria bacterium]